MQLLASAPSLNHAVKKYDYLTMMDILDPDGAYVDEMEIPVTGMGWFPWICG
jgi:hypothetical protein